MFLVDEVGQFIGNDSHLMLNLQTITEELGTISSVPRMGRGHLFRKIYGRRHWGYGEDESEAGFLKKSKVVSSLLCPSRAPT